MNKLGVSTASSLDESHPHDRQSTAPKSTPTRRARKQRIFLSCEPCRRSKLRCDRQHPCGTCRQRNCLSECSFRRPNNASVERARSRTPSQPQPALAAGGTVTPPLLHSSAQILHEDLVAHQASLSETQDPPSSHARWDAVLQRPTVDRDETSSALESLFVPLSAASQGSKDFLIQQLPSNSFCEYLITEYFTHLSPLFHVLHGPTFEKQYAAFLQNPSKATFSWLALLFMICSVTLNAIDPGDMVLLNVHAEELHDNDISATVHRLRRNSLTCLAEDKFLICHDLNTLETILILTYSVSHSEGVERGWILLGMALNMGIALRCNVNSEGLSCIETERRRRCWAGILMLHTYQAILFRDVDMSFLLNIKAEMPTDAHDNDIHENGILQRTSGPTQMSLMKFKLRLFKLSAQIGSHISGPSKLDQLALNSLDAAIAAEERLWDSTFLVNGLPSLLDLASYAHWCILQTYSHQLYLLIHQPFHNPQHSTFLAPSRERCIKSSFALLNLYREFYELPRLRHFRWLVRGMTTLNALHGAVALVSCLLSMPSTFDSTPYWNEFNATVTRMEKLQNSSPVCTKAFKILEHVQRQISTVRESSPSVRGDSWATFEGWIDSLDWFNWDPATLVNI
ncbi:unnamed protein product [Penicillium olsonii]|nr:unnamed protein product [Penicillium olsonii]